MNVLSLFDGISAGRVALDRAGVKYDKYFASEIDKYAIKVAVANFPDTVQLGDIHNVRATDLPKIDLLIGGSPCQSFSIAGNGTGFDGKSKLLFEYVRVLEEIKLLNPDVKFLLENVKMKKEWQDTISNYLRVEPIEINSSLLSAQNRRRLYWTNIEGVTQPEDKGLVLRDILENNVEGYGHSDAAIDYMNRVVSGGRTHWDFAHHHDSAEDKSQCITANIHKGAPYNVLIDRRAGFHNIRKLTPVECERLQTLPDNWTEGISDTQRYRVIGNGWTVDVIAHIFKSL